VSEFSERPPADHSLIGRMVRAARLDPRLYAEVEADDKATSQAAAVVLLAALAGGVNFPGQPAFILVGGAMALVSWYLFSYVIYLVGGRLLPEPQTEANFKAVLRAVGFAYAPGVVRLLGIVPELQGPVLFVAFVWTLVATITAVRHALSYTSTWRAIGVCTVPLLGQLIVAALIAYSQTPHDDQGMAEPPVVPPWFD
jgi:ATP/ADP translocase